MQTRIRNKALKLGVIAVLILGLVLSLVFLNGNEKMSAFAMESRPLLSLEKIHSRATIDEDFDGTTVVVVLDRNLSGVNKRHSANFFGDIEIAAIEDLSVVSSSRKSLVDEGNFEQVLQLTLPQDCKETVLRTIEQISKIDGVKYAGPNRIRQLDRTPNDLLYTHQWAPEKMQAPSAWNITTGNRDTVRVGIIDTGVANHPDLNANVAGGGDFVNGTTTTVGGVTTFTPGALRADPDGHGTHVAGIVGAVGNNTPAATSSIGVTGANWNVTLVPMQVGTNTGGISDTACIRAVNFATNAWNTTNRIHILSFSIGSYSEWTALETEIRAFSNVGGLFVCSTGNQENDNDDPEVIPNEKWGHHYPSFYASALHTNPIANMIAVGRSNENDERPANSRANWGAQTISVFAPGQNILSTYPVAICEDERIFLDGTRLCEFGIENRTFLASLVPGTFANWDLLIQNFQATFGRPPADFAGSPHQANGYHFMSGSSMSTPQVSGLAALMLSANPNLTGAQLRATIMNNVDIPNVGGVNPLNGLCVTNGRINAFKAVSAVAFTTSSATNGISITGFRTGYTMPNNTNLTLPESFAPLGTTTQQTVTAIGNSAFANCTQLSQITIPASVINIYSEAFQNCGLTSIEIPESVQTIGSYAFADCTSIVSVSISSGTIGNLAFAYCTKLRNVTLNGVSSIGDHAFMATDIRNISIPSSVKSINYSAFSNCGNLSSISFADNSVTSIGSYAFSGTGLTQVTLPSSLTSIEDYTFYGTGLTQVTLPNGLTSIGSYAFSGTGLTQVTLPSGLTSIGSYAFSGTGLTQVTLPSSVTSIGSYAFSGTGLTQVTLNNPSTTNITTLGTGVFGSSLSKIYLTDMAVRSKYLTATNWSSYASKMYVKIAFTELTANGSYSSGNTTQLTLGFEPALTGLTASNISLSGATLDSLSYSNNKYTLSISNITVGHNGYVSVTLTNPTGVELTSLSKSVTVYVHAQTEGSFAGGDGTASNPYQIATAAHLEKVAQLYDDTAYFLGYFVLISDIYLNDTSNWANWGTSAPQNSWTPIGSSMASAFAGYFNGCGYVIRGLYINTTADYQGLFGYVDNAIIMNVGIEQSYIKGGSHVGAIAGTIGYSDRVFINNCYNSGTVVGYNFVGGLVGSVNRSTIINSYNSGIVESSIDSVCYTGGIVGAAFGFSYGNNYVSIITNCYNVGELRGWFIGGIVAYIGDNTYVVNNYNKSPYAGEVRGLIVGIVDGNYNTIVNNFSISPGGLLVGQVLGNNSIINGNVNLPGNPLVNNPSYNQTIATQLNEFLYYQIQSVLPQMYVATPFQNAYLHTYLSSWTVEASMPHPTHSAGAMVYSMPMGLDGMLELNLDSLVPQVELDDEFLRQLIEEAIAKALRLGF